MPSASATSAMSASSSGARSGAIFSSSGLARCPPASAARASSSAPSSPRRRLAALQVAQARRVGRRDVDGDVVDQRVEPAQARDVVGDRIGAVAVGADVGAEHARALRPAPRAARRTASRPSLLKPMRLISACCSAQPEQPRPGIAGLRPRRHRADLDQAEALARTGRRPLRRSCRSRRRGRAGAAARDRRSWFSAARRAHGSDAPARARARAPASASRWAVSGGSSRSPRSSAAARQRAEVVQRSSFNSR